MFTAFTGVGFGMARYLPSRLGQGVVVITGFLIAIAAHSIHNFLLAAGGLCFLSLVFDWSGVVVILVAVVLSWRREKEWIETHLASEVASGVLTSTQYQGVISWRKRMRRVWRALGSGGWQRARLRRRFAQAATELAFKKHRRHAGETGEELEMAIASARAEVVRLRRELGDRKIEGRVLCPRCGRPSPRQAERCEHCGAPL
jgi:lysylphosphatidylglycerol synthetase-like protein (DUF2156 family)